MTHKHIWYLLGSEEKYISRGDCVCGAVRFFPNLTDKKVVERTELLNSTKSKEGNLEKLETLETTAVKEQAPIPKQSSIEVARKARDNKCRTCCIAYEHDEVRWCSSPKCNSRLPVSIRLTYRPKVENPSPGNNQHEFKTPLDKSTSEEDNSGKAVIVDGINLRDLNRLELERLKQLTSYLLGYRQCAREMGIAVKQVGK